jgi:hypothetical protein
MDTTRMGHLVQFLSADFISSFVTQAPGNYEICAEVILRLFYALMMAMSFIVLI